MSEKQTIGQGHIDAGAQYLRETQMSGRSLMPWDRVSKQAKAKWLKLSEGTLLAAFAIQENTDGNQ